ncbi:hypothetical protein [Pacificoceanicola onchidii]|uniref:hypothetical protein n=1 Tax=Pacificoceanicola onchidii TaxID=2562685 RepID=UPI0010A30F1C|nr:hypothetical protein [Pacificoceanicola onchidii]
MIRPEAAQALSRFREILIGLAVLLLGLYWAFFTGGGLLHWIGYAVAVLGIVLIATGLQRLRFPSGKGGPGVVEVTERQITYLAAQDGGTVSIDELSRIDMLNTDDGPLASDVFWVFTETSGARLVIPTDAENSRALFDAVNVLEGVDWAAVTASAADTTPQVRTIWRKSTVQNLSPRVH